QWTPNNVISFTRNPDYYLKDELGIPLPYMDTMDILRIADPSTLRAAFDTGKTHFETFMDGVIGTVRSRHPEAQLLQSKVISYNLGNCIVLHAGIAPTNDQRVRQAVSMAFDRKAFQDAIYAGNGWIGGGILQVNSLDWLLSEDELRKLVPYDPAGAKQLL